MKLSVPGRGGSADDSSRNRLALPLASFLNDLAWELPVLLLPPSSLSTSSTPDP